MRLKPRDGKANESGERRDLRNFHRPQSITVPLEMGLEILRKRVALGRRQ